MNSIQFRIHRGRALMVHTGVPAERVEWEAYVETCRHERPSGVVVLALSSTPGPNAMQRRQLAEMWKQTGNLPPVAVVTESAVHRSVITAFQWISGSRMCAFRYSQFPEALAHAGVAEHEFKEFRTEFCKLAGELRLLAAYPFLSD